jgi:hypothetical protein
MLPRSDRLTPSDLTPGEREAVIAAADLALDATKPRVSVLVPFRGDGGWRDTVWEHCRKLWEALPYELVIGACADDGPFNIAQAFNDAACRASGDIFILYGADQLPDRDRIEWAAQQLETHKWCALYANTAGYGETSTNAILQGYALDRVPLGDAAPFCTAIIAIRADSWVRFDERFIGWGGEDTAWRMVLETIYGPTPPPTGTLRCLYHPAASRDHTDANFALIGEYIAAQHRMVEYVTELGLI